MTARKIRQSLNRPPKPFVSEFDRKCFKKELCRALEEADAIAVSLYGKMHEDLAWRHATSVIEELIILLDSESG